MAEITCPRCGVPLHDQPDYCWSCGFYVGDRWRTVQLDEPGAASPRVLDPVEAAPEVRTVSGDAGSDPAPMPIGRERWVVRAIALAAVVILALLALALFGGRSGGVAGVTATPAGAHTSEEVPASDPTGPTGPTTTAAVKRIVDGDTIVVDIDGEDVRVRYIGMDTPESVKPDTPIEPYAEAAAAANRELVDGREVILERDVSETDQYGRLLRNVWVERDGIKVLVGLELVRKGLAQVTTFPPDVAYIDRLLDAQAQARDGGVGVWSTP